MPASSSPPALSPPATVHTVLTLAPVLEALETTTPQDLVVFDVDQVLLDPTDWILSGQGDTVKWAHFNDIMQRLGQSKFDYLYSLIVRDRAMAPLDAQLPQAIARLQQRGVRTLALTAFWDGPYGVIQDMSAFRVAELLANGYNFSAHQPVEDIYYKEHLSPRLKRHPRLRQGVITTSHVPKGEVLLTYLHRHHIKPQRIIFVDDNQGFMDSVHKTCQKAGLPLEGYLLLQASPLHAPTDPHHLSLLHRRAQVQFHYLEQHEVWLNDGAATEIMAQSVEGKKV